MARRRRERKADQAAARVLGLWLRAFHRLPPMEPGELEWRRLNVPQGWLRHGEVE